MNLIELLNKLKHDIRFGEDRKNLIKERLVQFIEAGGAVRENRLPRHIQQTSNIFGFLLKPISMPVFAIITILALMGGGTSLAAQNALPGDFLYPVKVNVNENIVAGLAFTAEAKAKVETDLAERRLEEAAELAEKSHMSAEAK